MRRRGCTVCWGVARRSPLLLGLGEHRIIASMATSDRSRVVWNALHNLAKLISRFVSVAADHGPPSDGLSA